MKNIKLSVDNLTALHSSLEIIEDKARVSKIEKLDQDDTNSFVSVNDFKMKNGIIEVDVCGKLREDAPAHARGFIGLVFRVNDLNSEFESFYIRPTNGRDCTDPIRKKHACQYFAYPGYTFAYFREFNVAAYEHAIDTIALNEWAHIKAVLNDNKGEFYVNGELVLTVDPMIHLPEAGRIGLYTDIGTDGYFKNLKAEVLD